MNTSLIQFTEIYNTQIRHAIPHMEGAVWLERAHRDLIPRGWPHKFRTRLVFWSGEAEVSQNTSRVPR